MTTMTRDELTDYLIAEGAVKTAKIGVYRCPGRGKEIAVRDLGNGTYLVREVACNC